MFKIMLDLSEELMKNCDIESSDKILRTVFSDDLVIEWASDYTPQSQEERKITQSVINQNLDNIYQQLLCMIKYRESLQNRIQLKNRLLSPIRKIKRFLK